MLNFDVDISEQQPFNINIGAGVPSVLTPNRFTMLLDTFPDYVGKEGQFLKIDELNNKIISTDQTGVAPWGSILGNIEDQSDLVARFNEKANLCVNQVQIQSNDDIPDELVHGTCYDLCGNFVQTKPFICPPAGGTAVIRGNLANAVVWAGTGGMIRDNNGTMGDLWFSTTRYAAAAGNKLFEVKTDILSGTLGIDYCQFIAFDPGVLEQLENFYFTLGTFIFPTNELELKSMGLSYIHGLNIKQTIPLGGKGLLKVTGSGETVDFTNVIAAPQEGDAIFNITQEAESLSIITDCRLNKINNGTTFLPGSKDETDPQITVKTIDPDISDSTTHGHLTFRNNSTSTIITYSNVPVKVAGTYVQDDAQRITTTSSGRFTYIGLKTINLEIKVNMTVQIESGIKIPCSFYVNSGNDTNNLINSFAPNGGVTRVTVVNWNKRTLANNDKVVFTNTTNYNRAYTISNVSVGSITTSFDIPATYIANDQGGKWGVIRNPSVVTQALSNGEPAIISMIHDHNFGTNDYIEIFVENNSTTSDLLVSRFIGIIRP